jgi:NADPH:quinone reductase-like Zn-dependent oxidoreductase
MCTYKPSCASQAEAMGFKVGDRVSYSILETYSEYSAVPAGKLQPVPANVGLDIATACVVQVRALWLSLYASTQSMSDG